MNDGRIRLNKFIAVNGVASRRMADEMIGAGRVFVNGVQVRQLGITIDPLSDSVFVDGEKIDGEHPTEKVYFAVNKPRGYVSTTTERFGEKIVTALVSYSGRLYPVGRLDKDSEGLLILTNDGDVAYALSHPKFEMEKKYEVLIKGNVREQVLERLRQGVEIDDGKTARCKVKVLSALGHGEYWLEFILHEGRKRQIRRMCAAVHLFVERLVRVQIGEIRLDGLKSGESRILRKEEIIAFEQ